MAFMYRHLFSFTLPVELCSGRPNCGATQSFGEKFGSSCDCSSPGLQVGWLGRKPAACLFLEFLSLFLGNVRFGFPAQDRSEPVQRQFLWACSRVKFLPLPAFCRSALRGELLPLADPPQLETTAMASTNCVWFFLGTAREGWSASS